MRKDCMRCSCECALHQNPFMSRFSKLHYRLALESTCCCGVYNLVANASLASRLSCLLPFPPSVQPCAFYLLTLLSSPSP